MKPKHLAGRPWFKFTSTVFFPRLFRAVERAWKAWQFHGARTWKEGPEITKTKEKLINQKKFSYFGALICRLLGPRNSQALGCPIQPIQSWTYMSGWARKHWFHGARPGSRHPWDCSFCVEQILWNFSSVWSSQPLRRKYSPVQSPSEFHVINTRIFLNDRIFY
jgi:hypothetical protein